MLNNFFICDCTGVARQTNEEKKKRSKLRFGLKGLVLYFKTHQNVDKNIKL